MVKALVIVAHPDDETIWMGGTILKMPSWEWTIFSLCRKDDSDRMPKFQKVCQFYGAESIISDLDDEKLEPLSADEIVAKINENLPVKKFDYIFTHGENGEYGHIRHKEIHLAVKKMIEDGELECEKAFYFSYVPGEETARHDPELKIPVPNESSDWKVKLSKDLHREKVGIITDMYGFGREIFETQSCDRMEAFSVLK